jgi:membrane dipeptidase
MKKERIQKIDIHIDIADIYRTFQYSQNDFYSQKDLPVTLAKLQEARVRVLGASLYFDESFLNSNFYDGVNNFYNWYKKLFSLNSTINDVRDVNKESDKVFYIYTIEGIQCFRTPKDFNHFFDLGVKIFGLTWQKDNDYACGRNSKHDTGISRKGFAVLEMMKSKSLIIDIAHLSEKSVKDTARIFDGTIVSTHSNIRSVYDSTHNLTDEEIQIIVDRGGVVSLFPFSADTGKNGTFNEFYKHIEYIINKWGEDYVAISSDIYPLDKYPFLEGYKDVLVLNGLEDFLIKKLNKKTVKKIFYDNWMRILKQIM